METGPLERIARAFAAIPAPAGNHGHPFHQPPSSAPTNAFSETRAAQTSTNDPLKVQLQLVDFESVPTFLDFLGAFGGRVRELSLVNVAIGGGGGVGKDSVEHRCLPEIESVYLGYDGGLLGSLAFSFPLPPPFEIREPTALSHFCRLTDTD